MWCTRLPLADLKIPDHLIDDPINRPGTRFAEVGADRIGKVSALMREWKTQSFFNWWNRRMGSISGQRCF